VAKIPTKIPTFIDREPD